MMVGLPPSLEDKLDGDLVLLKDASFVYSRYSTNIFE
jgi:hypothetical protein